MRRNRGYDTGIALVILVGGCFSGDTASEHSTTQGIASARMSPSLENYALYRIERSEDTNSTTPIWSLGEYSVRNWAQITVQLVGQREKLTLDAAARWNRWDGPTERLLELPQNSEIARWVPTNESLDKPENYCGRGVLAISADKRFVLTYFYSPIAGVEGCPSGFATYWVTDLNAGQTIAKRDFCNQSIDGDFSGFVVHDRALGYFIDRPVVTQLFPEFWRPKLYKLERDGSFHRIGGYSPIEVAASPNGEFVAIASVVGNTKAIELVVTKADIDSESWRHQMPINDPRNYKGIDLLWSNDSQLVALVFRWRNAGLQAMFFDAQDGTILATENWPLEYLRKGGPVALVNKESQFDVFAEFGIEQR